MSLLRRRMIICLQQKWLDNTMSAHVEAEARVRISTVKNIIDIRNLLPHQGKEVEQWSWRKLKNEKWIVFLDCKNNKIKMRKISY